MNKSIINSICISIAVFLFQTATLNLYASTAKYVSKAKSVSTTKYVHYNGLVGDVHPAYFNGQLYMYYLLTGGTYQTTLLKSNNLVTYTPTPIVTDPSLNPYSVLYVFKKPNINEYVSYYAGSNHVSNGILVGSKSTNLINWNFMGNSTTVLNPLKTYQELRDPFVFWNSDRNNYWAIRSAWETTTSTWEFLYYTSSDLTNWVDKGTLYKTKDVYDRIECPQMFKMGNYWYMLYSVWIAGVGRPQYYYSTQPEGPWTQVCCAENTLDGSDNCAAQVVQVNSKFLLYGWIPSADVETIGYQEWGGTICLPRELTQNEDGTLNTRLESTVSTLIRGASLATSAPFTLTSASTTLPTYQTLPGTRTKFDMTIKFQVLSGAKALGVEFLVGTKKIRAEFSQQKLSVITSGTSTITHSSLQLPLSIGVHTLRVISDDDVLECFVDDQFSLAAMVSANISAATIKPYVINGSVAFSEFQIFALNNTNAIP